MTAKYDFMKHRKVFFSISLVLIALILGTALILGVPMDIQFKGGAMVVLGYQGDLDMSGVKDCVSGILGNGLSFQQGNDIATGANSLTITMPGAKTVTAEQIEKALSSLDVAYPDSQFEQLQIRNVNPTIGKEFFHKSWVAVAAACLLILVYIAFRFRKIGGLPAGIMAIIALINDLFVVFGVFVVLRIPLNGNFIA
ncbi:protein-export membrane protein, partial [gut metagenome]